MRTYQILMPWALLFTFPFTINAENKTNVILILADDLGWADTTLYGKTSFYETPNIERLAARGITFSNAYAASPICSPTRGSILIGQNPARHGMTAPAAHLPEIRFEPTVSPKGLPHQKSTAVKSSTRLDPGHPTLPQLVKNAGYATAHFGKWHLGRKPHSPLESGFDTDIPHWHGSGPKSSYLAPWGYDNPDFEEGQPGEHIEDRMAQEATSWIRNRHPEKPFYMNYWQFSVHAPFGAKPELIAHYSKKADRNSAQCSPTYAAMVHSLDDAVGRLLDTLDAEGIADNTIIVFYSDNGGNIHCGLEEKSATGENYITAITSNAPLRGGKGGIHEGGIRVPAIVVWPGVTQAGTHSDVRIQSTDLYPTILNMLGVPIPEGHKIDGVDFTRALRGQTMSRKPMLTYVPSYGNTPQWLPPSMAVHYGDWKLIRTFHHGKDGGHEYRLYNLRDDIGESHNLAISHPEKLKALDTIIEEFIAEAEVVVPIPNPMFNPETFDASTIGVQKGGLKMPPQKKKPGTVKAPTTVSSAGLKGWIARNASVEMDKDILRLKSSGREIFLANSKVRSEGPVNIRARIRGGGKGKVQWRTEEQPEFPSDQFEVYTVTGKHWTEVSISLPVQGKLVQLRFFPPNRKREAVEIDWIEIEGATIGERVCWDFGKM